MNDPVAARLAALRVSQETRLLGGCLFLPLVLLLVVGLAVGVLPAIDLTKRVFSGLRASDAPSATVADIDAWKTQGDRLAEAIARHLDETGTLPPDLASLGQPVEAGQHGSWRLEITSTAAAPPRGLRLVLESRVAGWTLARPLGGPRWSVLVD